MQKTNRIEFVGEWSRFLSAQVLYLPILGPVYLADYAIEKIVSDILNNTVGDTFLTYDKNKRWSAAPSERLLLDNVIFKDHKLFIPVLGGHEFNTLKIFYYAAAPLGTVDLETAREIYLQSSKEKKIKKCFVYCFAGPSVSTDYTEYNIYLQKITANHLLSGRLNEICYFDKADTRTRATFEALGRETDMEGFDFLWREFITKGKKLSPIVCLVRDNEIIGAIGPLDVWPDGCGVKCLLPPYFGVKEKFRGKDCGERLWKEAMSYALKQGAQYTLVQNSPGSLAAQFYEAQGLSMSGKVFICPLPESNL